MIIASWNVNSIRARRERVLPWLSSVRPDVLCLQELKTEEKDFPVEAFTELGYHVAGVFQKTYNGVAILSRTPISDVKVGLDDGVDDPQARLIAGTVEGVRILCCYVPNGGVVGSDKYAYKLTWLSRLRRYLEVRHAPTEPLLVAGDFNVAPDERDVYNPVAWASESLFHVDSRKAIEELCSFGLKDTFRLHPQEAGVYSWWDYRMLGFAKNRGLRIDLLLATEPLSRRCVRTWIDREARKGQAPSDHAPVLGEF